MHEEVGTPVVHQPDKLIEAMRVLMHKQQQRLTATG
jgi:hypothetical protein